jgi:multidrug efflux pump subunit AcrA (membrane-fusion protein)
VRTIGLALVLIAASLGPTGCSDRATGTDRAAGTAKPPPPPAVPVGVATAEQRIVPVQVTAVGNVQAVTTVGI